MPALRVTEMVLGVKEWMVERDAQGMSLHPH